MASDEELIRRCEASREDRRHRYGWSRLWFLRGTDRTGPPARYNKLRSHIKKLTSYLYAPEGTRFALQVPPESAQEWLDHLSIARNAFLRCWRDSSTDVNYAQHVIWSLVLGTSIAKILPEGPAGVVADYVWPGDFGVTREDVNDLDRQDAFVHWYSLSIPEVERLTQGMRDQAKIIQWARDHAIPNNIAGGSAMPTLLQEVIITNTTGDWFGSGARGQTDLSGISDMAPNTDEPLVEAKELWQRREFKTPGGTRFEDYWVSTYIGEWKIVERRNPILPYVDDPLGNPLMAQNPFVKLCTDPLIDLFWGQSEMLPLVQLQAWREERMRQIDQIFQLQLDPPRFFSGVALPDEKLAAMRKPGGYASTPQPGAKVDVMKPDMPTDAFAVIAQIDQMFADAAGLPPILEGQNEQGVRAGNQASTIANIAGGRIREQALVVEDAMETLATRMFHLLQRRDETAYPLPNGKHFLLAQLPCPVNVKVSAHSASPVYAEQVIAKAQLLKREKAIDLPTFVDLIDPPHREELVEKSRVLEKGQAEQAAKIMQIQELKATRPSKR